MDTKETTDGESEKKKKNKQKPTKEAKSTTDTSKKAPKKAPDKKKGVQNKEKEESVDAPKAPQEQASEDTMPTLKKEEPKPVEFKNVAVTVTVYKKPNCLIEMHVAASSNLAISAHKKALRAISKQVSFPGFRKGKAPDEMVLKQHPKDIDKQWEQEISNVAFRESQTLTQLPLLDANTKVSFKMNKRSFDGADLILSFETTPTPPDIDPKTIQLKKVEAPKVDEAKIDESIDQVRYFFAAWKQITDRPVKEGDLLLIDIEDMDATPPVKVFSDTRFEVTERRMAQWMKDLVIGMNEGDSKEGLSAPDETSSEEEKKEFQPKKVRITIKKIEEAELPTVNDDFAKKLGVQTALEMRTAIGKLLQKQVDDFTQKKLREQASELLLNQYPFDLPLTLIQREARFRMEQLGKDPKFIQYWKGLTEDQRKSTVNEIYTQSEKAVRMFYLCRKIVSDAHITITPDDVPPAPSNILEILLQPRAEAHFQDQEKIGHSETYSRLIMEKAEDHLIRFATLV